MNSPSTPAIRFATSDDGAWQPYLGGGVTVAIAKDVKLEADLE